MISAREKMADASNLCTRDVKDGVLIATLLVEQLREAKMAYELRDKLISLIQESRPSDVVIDLGKAKFIGSIGFLAFLAVRRELPNGRIVLCNLFQPVRDMFAVSRLIQTAGNQGAPFEVAATKEAALARLQT